MSKKKISEIQKKMTEKMIEADQGKDNINEKRVHKYRYHKHH